MAQINVTRTTSGNVVTPPVSVDALFNNGGAYYTKDSNGIVTPLGGGSGLFDAFITIHVSSMAIWGEVPPLSPSQYDIFQSNNLGKQFAGIKFNGNMGSTIREISFSNLNTVIEPFVIQYMSLLETINLDKLESASEIDIYYNTPLLEINLPKLYKSDHQGYATYAIDGIIPILHIYLDGENVTKIDLSSLEYGLDWVWIGDWTNSPLLTTVLTPILKQIASGFGINSSPLATINLPLFEQGYLYLYNIGNTTLVLPAYDGTDTSSFDGSQQQGYNIQSNANLVSISMPNYIGNDYGQWNFNISDNPILETVSLPSQTKFGNEGYPRRLRIADNISLTTITLNAVPNLMILGVRNNALTLANEIELLTALIAGGNSGGSANFSGGTNAAFDFEADALRTILVNNGWNIQNN